MTSFSTLPSTSKTRLHRLLEQQHELATWPIVLVSLLIDYTIPDSLILIHNDSSKIVIVDDIFHLITPNEITLYLKPYLRQRPSLSITYYQDKLWRCSNNGEISTLTLIANNELNYQWTCVTSVQSNFASLHGGSVAICAHNHWFFLLRYPTLSRAAAAFYSYSFTCQLWTEINTTSIANNTKCIVYDGVASLYLFAVAPIRTSTIVPCQQYNIIANTFTPVPILPASMTSHHRLYSFCIRTQLNSGIIVLMAVLHLSDSTLIRICHYSDMNYVDIAKFYLNARPTHLPTLIPLRTLGHYLLIHNRVDSSLPIETWTIDINTIPLHQQIQFRSIKGTKSTSLHFPYSGLVIHFLHQDYFFPYINHDHISQLFAR